MRMEPKLEYLLVEISGPFNFQRGKAFFEEVVTTCAEIEQSKVLIDFRGLEGEVSITDRYYLGKHIVQALENPIKIAFVGKDELVLSDKFMENVTRNLGVASFVTTDFNEAVRWLGTND